MYTHTYPKLFHKPKVLTLHFLTPSNCSDLFALQDKNTEKFYGHLDTKISGSKVYNL